MNLLSSLGFTSPWLLALLPAALSLLVYIYRKHGFGQRITVPTLFILRQVAQKSRARRKFTPPWRFYLELVVLSLLIAGIAGMYLEQPAVHVAILIDNSFSMSKISAGTASAETDLAVAIREASAYLGSLSDTATVNVFASSPTLHTLTQGEVGIRAGLQSIEKLNFEYSADHLDIELARLALDTQYDKIAVFTDRQLDSNVQAQPSRIQVRSISPTSPSAHSENIAISSVATRSTSKNESVEVFVANYADSLVAVKVSVAELTDVHGNVSSDPLKEQRIVIPKLGRASAVFDTLSPTANTLQVHIEAEHSPGQPFIDSISADNTAWVAFNQSDSKVLLVSPLHAEELGLNKVSSLEFEALQPEQYEGLSADKLQNFQAAIFHRYSPHQLPAINAAFIFPQESDIFPPGPSDPNPQLARWAGTHPILNYLNMPALELKRVETFKAPPWATELIASGKGPIALAADFQDHRYAAFGFEILPFEGKRAPFLSILFLNALRFISDSGFRSGYFPVGGKIASRSAVERVQYFGGTKRQELELTSENIVAGKPGLYFVHTLSKRTDVYAVNFFDERESDTFNVHTVQLPTQSVGKDLRQQTQSVVSTLALIVSIILFGDLLVLLNLIRRRRVES